MFRYLIAVLIGFFCSLASALGAGNAPELSQQATSSLIVNAKPDVRDARGWAVDLLDVLRLHELPASRENVCASIAIIAQESGFQADPAVAGLGRLSEKSIRDKLQAIPLLGRTALSFLETTPSTKNSYMQRIRAARTERDLDMTYRAMVADAAKQSRLGVVVESGLLNTLIEDRNQINTIGSMQVSVVFAMEHAKKRRWLPMSLNDDYAVRDELYTRRGGMYYGVLQLLGYETGYDRKIYRFADYNAGRYASRNAAFQKQISALSGEKLATDGDLLLYDKSGRAKKKPSSSEKALRKIVNGIDDKQLRADLLHEKKNDFVSTRTYVYVREEYAKNVKQEAKFAEVPAISLSSIKIKNAMTTQNFADRVNKRYQACMAKKI
jgi:Protein of unknown function (DUF1615)